MKFKKLLAGIAGAMALAGSAQADLLITEVVDGTLPGGLPKWVELTNTGASAIDFTTTTYSFGNMNNGGTDLGGGAAAMLTGTIAAGGSYVIAFEADNGPGASAFYGVYAADPDFYMGGAYTNGDDVVLLYLGAAVGDGTNATLLDVYGVIGVDGTGEPWEYTDSFSYRCGDLANGGVFDETDWHIEGANGLEAGCGGDDICETGNLLNWTTPWVHTGCTMAPGTPYCAGDGVVTPCPCGNNNDGSMSGCSWTATGLAGGALSATGSNVYANSDTFLEATNVSGDFGVFFSANGEVTGRTLGDGIRCAGFGLIRMTPSIAPGGSTATHALPLQTLDTGAGIGTTRYYQYWFRTAPGLCGNLANTTNGYEITWMP